MLWGIIGSLSLSLSLAWAETNPKHKYSNNIYKTFWKCYNKQTNKQHHHQILSHSKMMTISNNSFRAHSLARSTPGSTWRRSHKMQRCHTFYTPDDSLNNFNYKYLSRILFQLSTVQVHNVLFFIILCVCVYCYHQYIGQSMMGPYCDKSPIMRLNWPKIFN